MTERIQTLVKLITETRPVQSARRQGLIGELRALRNDLEHGAAADQIHTLDAAILLMEFMNRSQEVATAETIQIVASLVGSITESSLRRAPVRLRALPPTPPKREVSEHPDLRLTQDFLLGSILLQAGVISQESLARALHLHASSGCAVGECLVRLGAATAEQVAAAIGYQDHLREEERMRAEARGAAPAVSSAPVAPASRPAAVRHTTHLSTTPARAPQGGAPVDLRLNAQQSGVARSLHSQVLGEVLIRLGVITREQLENALQVQRAASLHIGEALVESGAADWDQIRRALDVQRRLRRGA